MPSSEGQFSRVWFDEPQSGSRARLSPNSCLLAYVTQGTTVVIEDVNEVFFSAERSSPEEEGGASGPSSRRQLGRYVALDEVTDLLWSPDSSSLAAWMASRATVEIISVASLVSIARIDGGLNGMKQLQWHPSSRCIYWFGHAAAYAVSLIDGTSMAFADPVKVTPPQSYSSWVLRGRSFVVSGANQHALAAVQAPADTMRDSSALFSSSRDSKFVFVVSPCTVLPKSPLPGPSHQIDVMAEVARIPDAALDETIAVTAETLNVFDSETHERVAAFPLQLASSDTATGDTVSTAGKAKHLDNTDDAPSTWSVTRFFELSSCFLLYDEPNARVVLQSLDGQRVLGDFRDVVAVDTTSDGGFAFLLDSRRDMLITLASVYGRIHRLGDTPLKPSYLAREAPVLVENPVPCGDDTHDVASATAASVAPRAVYSVVDDGNCVSQIERYSVDALAKRDSQTVFAAAFERVFGNAMRDDHQSTAGERGGPRIDAVLAASKATAAVSASPCGTFVAVVSPRFPTTVMLIDVSTCTVRTVLRHEAAVSCVGWKPTTTSSPDSNTAALAIATDSRSGNVYLWTPACAMCASLPFRTVVTGKAHRGTDAAPRVAPASVTRLSWGVSGRALLLADDLADTFYVATLDR